MQKTTPTVRTLVFSYILAQGLIALGIVRWAYLRGASARGGLDPRSEKGIRAGAA